MKFNMFIICVLEMLHVETRDAYIGSVYAILPEVCTMPALTAPYIALCLSFRYKVSEDTAGQLTVMFKEKQQTTLMAQTLWKQTTQKSNYFLFILNFTQQTVSRSIIVKWHTSLAHLYMLL